MSHWQEVFKLGQGSRRHSVRSITPVTQDSDHANEMILQIQKSHEKTEVISEISFYADALIPLIMEEGSRVAGLIDTGASCNVMSIEFFRKLRIKRGRLQRTPKSFSTASGETVRPEGEAKITFRIGQAQFTETFYVCKDLINPVILGRRFLSERKAEVDFAKGQIRFRRAAPLMALATTVVQPRRSSLLVASFKDNQVMPTGLNGTIRPKVKRNGLQVLPTACTASAGKVPLIVTNDTDRPIHIKRGYPLSEFQALEADECPYNDQRCTPTNPKPQQGRPQKPKQRSPVKEQWLKNDCTVRMDRVPLPSGEIEELEDILYSCRNAFVDKTGKLGYNDWVPHRINMTPGTPPITKQPYRVPPDVKRALETQIKGLLEQGVLVEADTPWCSPVVPIKKGQSKTRKHLQDRNIKPEIRLTVDFRYVNANSLPNQAPINNIHDVIDGIGATKPKYFSSLDMKHGYFQQALHPDSAQYTGFMFNRRTYCFKTCPQGLNSSPFLFQKLMNKVLDGPMRSGQVFCYLDDILVVSSTWEEHKAALTATLKAIEVANLKLSGAKCTFAQPSVEFLGFTMSHEGVTPAQKHVEALLTYPVPRTNAQVKTFLGLVNFFRSWVPNRGDLLAPLQKLTRHDARFIWTPACQEAFERIREILTSHPVLAYPDFDKHFVVATDASTSAIGAVLCQPSGPENKLRPIAFLGRATTPQEAKWTITELEGLACVYAVKHWDVYLSSRRFTLYTDHSALTAITKGSRELSPKLARYALLLSSYNFHMEHCKGKLNTAADAMSRRMYDVDHTPTDDLLEEWPYDFTLRKDGESSREATSSERVCVMTRAQSRLAVNVDENRRENMRTTVQAGQGNDRPRTRSAGTHKSARTPRHQRPGAADQNVTRDGPRPSTQPNNDTTPDLVLSTISKREIRRHQLEETFCGDLIQCLETGRLPADLQRKNRCIFRKDDYCVRQGVLYHMWSPQPGLPRRRLRMVIPKPLQTPVIKEVHTSVLSSHLGMEKTVAMLKQRCVFKGMHDRVRSYIANCEVCHKVKNVTKKVVRGGSLYEMAEEPFMRVHVDFAGPLPTTQKGNRFFCVATDSCSGYTVSWSCRTLTAESFARNFYEKFVCVYGSPVKLCSDNATTFRSELWAAVARLLKIQMTFVAPYTPRSNGRAESAVKATMRVIRCMALEHGPKWDRHLPAATYALNNSLHSGHNLSPYNIVFGRSGRIPIDTALMAESPETPLFQIVEDIRESQRVAIETAVKMQAERDRRLLQKRPAEQNVDQLVAGSVVFWAKPNVKAEGAGKLAVPNHGPYVVTKRHSHTANLRHLHTGEFTKYAVNVEQLRLAKDYQLPPEQTEAHNGHPVWTAERQYRAHLNE